MNVQEAKELEITEGNVRTIHASDGKLLWGRLAYDTNYGGDTTQQTYSGKNLFNKNATPNQNYNTSYEAIDTGGRVTLTSLNNFAYTNFFYNFEGHVGQTVTFSVTATPSSSNRPQISIGTCDSAGQNRVAKSSNYGTGLLTVSYTLEAGDQYIYVNIYASSSSSREIGDYVDYTDTQLEFSSTATSYEPYVGGTASPNPSYPQTVNVVTGTQTITVTDGDDATDTYTVNLGAIELAKIGDYQDYIYKSGDDWYVHKEIEKSELGTLTWGHATTNQTGVYRKTTSSLQSVIKAPSTNAIVFDGVCSHFIANRADGSGTYGANQGISVNTSGSLLIYYDVYNTNLSSNDAAFTTWLQNNNVVLYYALATPTNTQITDTTLISQLEAVQEFLTRYGYQSTVVGDIPLIINQLALV